MENKMNTKSLKTGLLALGYVANPWMPSIRMRVL